jgi:hypothetical protein
LSILVIAGALLACGQSDANQDRRELHQDHRDVRQDRREVRRDQRDLKHRRCREDPPSHDPRTAGRQDGPPQLYFTDSPTQFKYAMLPFSIETLIHSGTS